MEFNYSVKEVFEDIKEKIFLKIPFLITRIGDGEAIVIERNESGTKNILKKHLGIFLKEEETEIIRKNLIETFEKSDIIGIHDTKLQGYFGKSFLIANQFCNLKNKKIVTVKFPYQFLKNWEIQKSNYDLLLNNLEEIFIIGGRNLEEGILRRFKVKKVKSFLVAPEFQYESVHNKSQIPHFPNRFLEIKQEIEKLGDLKGKLLFYGAGIVGKIYGVFWKNQGGVAVDLGSIFDLWDGKLTRGEGRGPNSIKLTYKL